MIDIMFIGIDHTHPADFSYYASDNDWWLLVEIKSKTILHTVKGNVYANPGTVVVYPPNSKHLCYEANGEPFVNSYVRFRTDEDFVINGNYPKEEPITPNLSSNFDYLLRVLSSEVYLGDSSSSVVNHIMQTIFEKLCESTRSDSADEYRQKLIDLRYEIIISPQLDWNMEELAKRFHVSAGYLSVLYKKEFGISCKEDIVTHRIELAKDMLANSQDPAVRIALMCGYKCTEHFTRQFKSRTGMTPIEYRKQVKG
ncbi:MAG: AraC family transcriptional regulator [Oscillospiraceae bacterium]|nr:AraC family transcriptional regulator [Oscillospiraceae bacterium]